MSARAAWRLEQLGFERVYDYVPSKVDWFACGMPRAGKAASVPWAGDIAREAPTCAPSERVGEVADRVRASGADICVVVSGEEDAVLGVLKGDALLKDPDVRADEVMELGPQTVRPSEPLEELMGSNDAVGVKHFLVATSHGAFLGLLDRDEAERTVREWRAMRSDMEKTST
jgi:hypothetical protein